MNKLFLTLIGLSLAAIVALSAIVEAQIKIITIDVFPGAPKIMAFKPTWCDAIDPEKLNRNTTFLKTIMEQIKEDDYIWEKSRDAMEILCIEPENPDFQTQAGYFAQAWANEVGFTVEQLTPFFQVYAHKEKFETARKTTCDQLQVSTEASSRIKALNKMNLRLYGCIADMREVPQFLNNTFDYGTGQENAWMWHLDQYAQPPSEATRAYLVLGCLRKPDNWNQPEPSLILSYSWCGTDARALDAQTLEGQMIKQSDFEKAILQLTHGRAKLFAAKYDLMAKQLAKDTAWKNLLFDTPQAAWKNWTLAYQANKTALDAARSYEELFDGANLSAAKNCMKQARVGLVGYAKSKKITTLTQAKQVFADRVASQLLQHVMLCNRAEGNTYEAFLLESIIAKVPTARGPRFQGFSAITSALAKVLKERPKFPVQPNNLFFGFQFANPFVAFSSDRLENFSLASDGNSGVIESLKTMAGGMLILFKKETWQEETFDCRPSSPLQITGWNLDGTPQYRTECKSLGTRTVSTTHRPVWIEQSFTTGLKPGMLMQMPTNTMHPTAKAFVAFPEAVWANKSKKQLVMYLGVPL
jgi:hypothetical protein